MGGATSATHLLTDTALGDGVYKSYQLKTNRKTATKVVEGRGDVLLEVTIMQTLGEHPHIVKFYEAEYFPDGDRHYIHMEYLRGGQLHDLQVSNENRACQSGLFRQIASAVKYCHDHDVVHRDIKLENIMLRQQVTHLAEAELVLIDFGLSAIQRPEDPGLTDYPGTIYFIAPEMVRLTKYRGRNSDIWALGVVLYILVCGQYPFTFEDEVEDIYDRIDVDEPKIPDTVEPDLKTLILQMLNKDAGVRYTIEQVLQHEFVSGVAF